jgi:hypothetical protein
MFKAIIPLLPPLLKGGKNSPPFNKERLGGIWKVIFCIIYLQNLKKMIIFRENLIGGVE